ncbi:transposase [Amycolatopsis pithecellobii]|uniref:transposase n=1 Tax=Amycolatopsis pithecellobii TaxID=664692 RepID=UPI001AA0AFE1|nr:transposase [Amycolatopsis pithecellobii]
MAESVHPATPARDRLQRVRHHALSIRACHFIGMGPGQRRPPHHGNIDEAILSLYSRGMTTRDSESQLYEVYGVNASRELISTVTEVATVEIVLWQSRSVGEMYLGVDEVLAKR